MGNFINSTLYNYTSIDLDVIVTLNPIEERMTKEGRVDTIMINLQDVRYG